ncbi:hypothetical protein GCM10010219_11300 [Streptomyces netropsis]|nr:hypothetical protein GCM10010219_11300 [Streptomyces netropsis]
MDGCIGRGSHRRGTNSEQEGGGEGGGSTLERGHRILLGLSHTDGDRVLSAAPSDKRHDPPGPERESTRQRPHMTSAGTPTHRRAPLLPRPLDPRWSQAQAGRGTMLTAR